FDQTMAYEVEQCLEFRRVLFRSETAPRVPGAKESAEPVRSSRFFPPARQVPPTHPSDSSRLRPDLPGESPPPPCAEAFPALPSRSDERRVGKVSVSRRWPSAMTS